MKSLVAAWSVAVCLSAAAAEPIALVNASFEASTDKPTGWTYSHHAGINAYRVTIDASARATGEQSLRMERVAHQVYGLVEQRVRLPATLTEPRRLRYAAQLRTEDVGPLGWMLVINFLSERRAILEQVRSTPMTGTNPWREAEIDHPAPAGTRMLALGVLMLDGGVAWIDDVRVQWD